MDTPHEIPAVRPGRYFRRRHLIIPTWRVMLPLLAVIAAFAWWLVNHAYGWLSPSEPIDNAPFVIVEGWLPDYAIRKAADQSRGPEIEQIYCTGIPVDRGTLVSSFGTYAEYAAVVLGKMDIPPEKITAVPAPFSKSERTRTMAKILAMHLRAQAIPAGRKQINLFTIGTHARRSHKIFQEELGPAWKVGVIAIPDAEIDEKKWYLQSNAAKNVITELVALGVGALGAN